MSVARPKSDHLWNWYPSFCENSIVKIVWFKGLNVALCFTVQMGFQSSDAIITKKLGGKVDIYGLYTLMISVIIYFVIIRSVLLELFKTVPLIIRRVIRRIEDGTNTHIIPPATYIMSYSYLPLNTRYESLIILKVWIVFKVLTAVFFTCCPIFLLGYTIARAFNMVDFDQNRRYKPKWNSVMSLETEVESTFIIIFGLILSLICFITKSVTKSKQRFNDGRNLLHDQKHS